MSRQELLRLGNSYEHVEIVAHSRPWSGPVSGEERRASLLVGLWFGLSAASGIAFLVLYGVWPDDYVGPGEEGYQLYQLNTPLLGGTFSFAIFALGIGLVLYMKRFFAEETSVQQRHPDVSDETTRRTAVAQLEDAREDSGVPRRPFIKRLAFGAAGLFGISAGVLAIGGFVRNPWTGGEKAPLRITGWAQVGDEKVYLRVATGVLGEIQRMRPENLQPGGMATVYPFRESERGDKELLLAAQRASDSPVMLIRLPPGTDVVERPGHESFNYGDFYAFSKICTHLGCPASEYDSQNFISMCPCHQSEFLISEYARPIFGPATRPLPQLPITVDEEGYFVARSDFREPVGPAFWSVRSDPDTD